MKNAVLKTQEIVRGELSNIEKTLTFCCGDKYALLINERLGNLRLYVYSDDLDNDKIKKVDLLNIAIDFAKDFTFDLNIDKERKSYLEKRLGVILLNSYYSYTRRAVPHSETKSYIKDELSNLEEFRDNLNDNVEAMFKLVELFNKDYEVNDLEKKIYLNNSILKEINEYSSEIKKELLKEFFNIDEEDVFIVNTLWECASFFKKELLYLLDDMNFKNEVIDNQAAFLSYIGIDGDNSYAIVNEARYKGLLPDSEKIYAMEVIYNKKYKDKLNALIKEHSNLEEIFSDLSDNDICVSKDSFYSHLFSFRELLGVQLPDINGKPACLLFYDKASLYSNIFIDTYFHEVIHFLGGVNDIYYKHRLIYNGDIRYACLDEAFTNCLAKECYDEYLKEYEYPNHLINLEDNCEYNISLEYMKEVFKLYKKELLEIHFGSMSLLEANKRCPFDEIAISVYRIATCEDDVDKVIEEEKKKLIRRKK